jgi:uncharacterized alkaline shock family protein YloU
VTATTIAPRAQPDAPSRSRTTTSDMVTDLGTTSIASNVVAKIAGIAAREVDGVHKLVPTGVGSTIAGFAQRIARADQRGLGVAVEVGQKEAAVDLAIEVEYGVEIRRVCDDVRRSVARQVESLAGLRAKEVNILVTDLHFGDDESQPDRRVE